MSIYSAFPFGWAEGHSNGHDYLLCGEDYQGYTVIELDTKERKDLLPESVPKQYTYKDQNGVEKSGVVDTYPNGYGFCWADIKPSPDRNVLAVSGCYWACPYEVVLYDFSDPMRLPYWEIERWDEIEDFDSWGSDGKITMSRTIEVRKSDGKPFADLSDDEIDQAEATGDEGEKTLYKTWEPLMLKVSRKEVATKEFNRLNKMLTELGVDHSSASVIKDLMVYPEKVIKE